jgi:hypothetical protein
MPQILSTFANVCQFLKCGIPCVLAFTVNLIHLVYNKLTLSLIKNKTTVQSAEN